MRRVLPLVLLIIWALLGMAQYGPGEGGYVRFQFRASVTGAVSCEQPNPYTLRCRVREGTSGVIHLIAEVTPPAPMQIRLHSAPQGWPGLPVATGVGTVSADYSFAVPQGSAGRRFELVFGAYRAGAFLSQLTVILEAESASGSFPVVTVPVHTTDKTGRFTVPVGELPDTTVKGRLSCGGKPMTDVPIKARLVPQKEGTPIRGLTDIGAVELSSPTFGTIRIPKDKLRFTSSFDITGRLQRTIEVGEVCPFPEAILTYPTPLPVHPTPVIEVPSETTVIGTTDGRGIFQVPMPGEPGEKVWGKLVDCTTGRPLKNQAFTLQPVYTEGKLKAFRISSTAFPTEVVTRYVRVDFSFFGRKGYNLGEIRVSTKTKADLDRELDRVRYGFTGDQEFEREYEESELDPARAVLVLGRYLQSKCFRVEVSRGRLTVEEDGERRTIEWTMLAVHIGDKVYLVEATRLSDFGTPKAVCLISGARGIRVLVHWVVWDEEYGQEVRARAYEETERLTLEDLKRELED